MRFKRLRRFEAEHHVLGDREDGDEHEVLVNHTDAAAHGLTRVVDRNDDTVDYDLALVGAEQPEEHVHQRRLSGAVLAEQRVDLTWFDRQS